MSSSSRRPLTSAPTTYALDNEQLLSISAALVDSDMHPRNLDDVPEEGSSHLESLGPYMNHSAASSATTFHVGAGVGSSIGGSGSGASTPISGQQGGPPTLSRPRKAPSVRTMGRPSNDQLQVAPGSSTSGSVRRAGPSVSATAKSTTRPTGAPGQPLHRYRNIPRLPHDKEVGPAPTTGMYWSKAPVWGALPARILRAHTATLVDTVVWIIGGNDDKDQSRDIYCFDTETMQWTHPDTVGEAPPACRAHTATLADRKIVVYGGGLGSHYFDGVYILDIATRRWTRPHILDGPHPAGRRAHTAVYYKNRVWVFGGGNGLTALNDVWTLDLGVGQAGVTDDPGPDAKRGLKWEEQKTSENKPGPRGYHTATLVGNIMVVIGGSDGKECFTDIWLLNLDTLAWSIVAQPQPGEYKRLSHSATQVGSYLFIIGGHTGTEYTSEILMLNLVSLHYEPRIIYGRPPSMRGNHATVLSDSRVFLFGGFNGQSAFDDVHTLDLAASAYLPQVTSFEIESF